MAFLIQKNQAPVNTVASTLWAQGTANPTTVQQNRPVFCTFGTWTVDSDRWYRREWRWYVNGVAVAGDDGNMPFYDVAGTVGDTIYCVMTCYNDIGQSTVVQTATVTVIADARTTLTAASLGFKTSTTTGSISAASTTLTVASTTGFALNDYIIIQTGGEAGLGLRGTEGVGGAWPPTSYADVAAMNADTSKTSTFYAWVRSTGDVWYWDTITSTWKQDARYYYYAKAIPRMHVAKITAIGASTFTLDTAAVVATTNATVYFDNTRPWWAIYTGSAYDNKIVTFPAGTFAFSNFLAEFGAGGFVSTVANGRTIQGAGRTQTFFKAPNGGGAQWNFAGGGVTSDCHFRDISIIGSRTSHEKFAFHPHRMLSSTAFPNSSGDGIVLTCLYSTARRVDFTNCFRSFVCQNYTNMFGADLKVTSSGLEQYIQWQCQFADMAQGGLWRVTVESSCIEPGFEPFRSTSVYFVDCGGVNVQAAINTSGDVLFDNLQVTHQEGKGTTPAGRAKISLTSDSFMSVNANIDPSSLLPRIPSWVRNLTWVQEGGVYGPSDPTTLKGIPVSPTFERSNNGPPSILVSGEYPRVPKGIMQVPDGFILRYGVSSNANVAVRGMRFKALAPTGSPAPENAHVGISAVNTNGLGLVRNCVAETVFAGGSLEQNTMTNAEYEALYES